MRRPAWLMLALFVSGCPKHPPRPSRVAVVSDLHLGDPRSILGDSGGRAWFAAEVERTVRRENAATLVIDGDALELSLADESVALDAARDLVGRLSNIPGLDRLVVIPGNHDHVLYENEPGAPAEKLFQIFDAGTPLHRALADSSGRLVISVVYPDYAIPVRGGTVHVTHGHWFDPWTTPKFDPIAGPETIERENEEWYALLSAGRTEPVTRGAYRFAYHLAQHARGWFEHDPPDPPQAEAADRSLTRVSDYLAMLRDPSTLALIAAHTHLEGGLDTTVTGSSGRTVRLIDTGSFVVSHAAHEPVRAFIAVVDPATGTVALTAVAIPDELRVRTEKRAFTP